jgi:hypothetical protein
MKSKEGAKVQPMFQIIDGTEKYKVIDLVTGGESFHDEKLDAYRMCHVLVNVLHHNYRLEVR